MKPKSFLKPIAFTHMALLFAVCFSAPLSSYGRIDKTTKPAHLAEAQYELSNKYYFGEGVKRDYKKAFE